MDEHLETSWCPACDRLIEPAKYLVELDDQNRQINILSSQQQQQQQQQQAIGSPVVTRQPVAPGLVRGTGRVQPNGTLLSLLRDRAPRTQSDSDLPPPVPPPSPVMHRAAARASSASRARRTVVSQQQTPLYCSAACRARDADSLGIRRLSESTATSGSTGGRSVFDKAATSATSLESYDLPPRDPSPKKVFPAHTLTWKNGTTGMGATPPRRDNNVRAPSPEPFSFLSPRAASFSPGRRASSSSVQQQQQMAMSAPTPADEVADRVARTKEFFDEHMPFVRVRNDQARQAHLDHVHSAASLVSSSSSLSSSSSSSSSKSRSRSHKKAVKAKSTSAPALPTLHESSPARRFRAPVILPRPGISLSGHESPELMSKWRRTWAEPQRNLVVWTGTHYATASASSPDASSSAEPTADYATQTYASGLEIYDAHARGYRRFLAFDTTSLPAIRARLSQMAPEDLKDLERPSNAEPPLAATLSRRIAHVDSEDRARERWILRRMPRRDKALVGYEMPKLRNWLGREVDEPEDGDVQVREMLVEQYQVLRVEALEQQRVRELLKREARAAAAQALPQQQQQQQRVISA